MRCLWIMFVTAVSFLCIVWSNNLWAETDCTLCIYLIKIKLKLAIQKK